MEYEMCKKNTSHQLRYVKVFVKMGCNGSKSAKLKNEYFILRANLSKNIQNCPIGVGLV